MKAFSREERSRAVVVGGSMAGLLAARTVADHFDDVLLIERDDLRDLSETRRGVPQSRHTHVLLASGCRVLEALFPGISSELTDAGAIKGDIAEKVRWFVEGGRLSQFVSGLEGLGMSRLLLERSVRARVRALGNVSLRDNCNVEGLVFASDGRRVAGVKTEHEIFGADLVVDASGRGSRMPRWLEEIGYAKPKEEKFEIELRYTTRLFHRCGHDLEGDNAAIIPPTPVGKRGGVMISQERDRWIVTLMTHFGSFAPTELNGFIDFARNLSDRCIYDVIRAAEPIDEAHMMRIPASVRRRYEDLKSFPAGLLVVGDAISSFNPIYGQGMSVAALQAVELGNILSDGLPGISRRFFPRAAKIVDAAWAIAAGNDLRMPEVTGKRNVAIRFTNAYVPRLIRAGHRDPASAGAFLNVSNLLAPPQSLLHPALIWRAYSGWPFSRARLRDG